MGHWHGGIGQHLGAGAVGGGHQARAGNTMAALAIVAAALVIVAIAGYGLFGFRTDGHWSTRLGF